MNGCERDYTLYVEAIHRTRNKNIHTRWRMMYTTTSNEIYLNTDALNVSFCLCSAHRSRETFFIKSHLVIIHSAASKIRNMRILILITAATFLWDSVYSILLNRAYTAFSSKRISDMFNNLSFQSDFHEISYKSYSTRNSQFYMMNIIPNIVRYICVWVMELFWIARRISCFAWFRRNCFDLSIFSTEFRIRFISLFFSTVITNRLNGYCFWKHNCHNISYKSRKNIKRQPLHNIRMQKLSNYSRSRYPESKPKADWFLWIWLLYEIRQSMANKRRGRKFRWISISTELAPVIQ